MIHRHHKPAPLQLRPDQKIAPQPPKGLGDYVEIAAKPIARLLNQLGPKIERLGRWCTAVGKPGSTCGCQSRKERLNAIALSFKHPFKSTASIIKCVAKKPAWIKPLRYWIKPD